MTGPKVTEPQPHNDVEGIQWVRVGALLATVGGAFVWIVTHWLEVKPVLESPAVVLLAMMTIYGLGGLSIYWIVSRPLEQRLLKTESLVSELRKVERDLLKDDASKVARIATLETEVKYLRAQISTLTQAVEAMGKPEQKARPPRKPKT